MRLIIKVSLKSILIVPLLFSVTPGNPIAPHWAQIDTTVPARYDFGAAYDALNNSIILFGGIDTSGQMPADTWEWNGSNWQRIAETGPVGRSGFGMCYMDLQGLILLYGGWSDADGFLGDTWIWDGVSWTEISTIGPPARSHFAMSYDQSTQGVILFGGTNGDMTFGDTWEWNGTGWSLVDTIGPVPRIYSQMASVPNNNSCLLFGGLAGYGGEILDDSWAWIGYEWVQLTGENPSPRIGHMMAYDPTWGLNWSVELFGGENGSTPIQFFDDTWELDDYGWYLVNTGEPPGRSFGKMIYDDSLQMVVVIGGTDSTQIFHDMWTYPVFDNSSCIYVPGDVNDTHAFTGLDVVYSVSYLKGGAAPFYSCECPVGSGYIWFVAGDVNGSCSFTGLDVTYMVAYLKGGADLRPCPECPPSMFR